MAENSGIEWTDSTFNPWIGCTKISPACDNCYAERDFDLRRHVVQWGAGKARKRTSVANWKTPLQWNAQPFVECMSCGWRGELREAEIIKNPPGFHPPVDSASLCPGCRQPMLKAARRRVFCASLADVFDNEVPAEWRADLFRLIEATPNLNWLLLTKRIGNASEMMFRARGGHLPLLPNLWLGATICNQAEANRDIPKLLQVPARMRFLSIEPMLGPIDLNRILVNPERGLHGSALHEQHDDCYYHSTAQLDWIICGGESGPQARPMHPDWARQLRDQCAAAGVPFLFKQWGEWAPGETCPDLQARDCASLFDGHWEYDRVPAGPSDDHIDDEPDVYRVGKKAAGRLLDGVEHNGYPDERTAS